MLILRLNHAQHAIADGRLEEACEILSDATLKQHRKGQELIGRLVKKLVQRGQEHLAADRYRDALADCERAGKFGGQNDEVVLLRDRALEADRKAAKKADRRKHAIVTAKRYIERGEIELGQAACDDIPDGTTVAELRKEADRRDALIASRLHRVETAFNNGEYADAVAGLRELKTLCPNDKRFVQLLGSVGRAVIDQANEAIDGGRLVNAVDTIDRIYGLVQSDAAIECRRSIELCQQIAVKLIQPDLRPVIADLKHLQMQRPGATWVADAIEAAELSSEARDRLNVSPLSFLNSRPRGGGSPVSPTEVMQNKAKHSKPVVTASIVPQNGTAANVASVSPVGLMGAFILQVDGAGSSLVIREPAVTFGPRSSSKVSDIEVLGPGAPQVQLKREEGDYFLQSSRPIVVNNRPTKSKLLSHGDRIELGPRSSLRFFLPCAASSSALIELTGCKTPRGGCRRLVLLDNAIVIASNGASHIRSSVASEPYVLFFRDGRLQARPMKNASEGAAADAVLVDFDTPIALGDINVVASSMELDRGRKV